MKIRSVPMGLLVRMFSIGKQSFIQTLDLECRIYFDVNEMRLVQSVQLPRIETTVRIHFYETQKVYMYVMVTNFYPGYPLQFSG